MEDQHRAADYVSRYADSLEVEVTDEMIVEGIQELLAWAPLMKSCITRTTSEFSLSLDGFVVGVEFHRRADLADITHASRLMAYEEIAVMLKDEWEGYLASWFKLGLLPTIRAEMQASRYFNTNRIDRGDGWTEVTATANNISLNTTTSSYTINPGLLRFTSS